MVPFPLLLLIIITELVSFAVDFVFFALVFFIAGRIVSGKYTTFRDALIVALIGSILATISHTIVTFVTYLLGVNESFFWAPNVAAILITSIAFLILAMKFFDTGFFGAIAIAMMSIVIFILINILSTVLAIWTQNLFLPPSPP